MMLIMKAATSMIMMIWLMMPLAISCHACCHATRARDRCVACSAVASAAYTADTASRRPSNVSVDKCLLCIVGEEDKFKERLCVEADVTVTCGCGNRQSYKLVLNHTRVGHTPASACPKGRKAAKAYKMQVLDRVFRRAIATSSASTPGVVVGDLNLEKENVAEFVNEFRGNVAVLDFDGGRGSGATRVAMHVAM